MNTGKGKGRQSDREMESIIAEIQADIDSAERKHVLTLSANDIAKEHGVHPQTVTAILRMMNYEYDGMNWYKK